MTEEQLKDLLVAIMLSGYSGAGGFDKKQLQYALQDVEDILRAVRGEEPKFR